MEDKKSIIFGAEKLFQLIVPSLAILRKYIKNFYYFDVNIKWELIIIIAKAILTQSIIYFLFIR